MRADDFARSIRIPVKVLPPGEKVDRSGLEERSGPTPGVITELRANCFDVTWVADLINRRMNYRPAIPILLKWLPRVDDVDLKQDIVRALSVPWARPSAAVRLVEEFVRARDTRESGLRWTIANALAVVADDTVFDDIVTLFRERGYGRAREMLAFALANMKTPRAVDVLIDGLKDDEVAGHSVVALGKLRAAKAKAAIQPFTTHEKAWVRAAAKKALQRIDRAKKSR